MAGLLPSDAISAAARWDQLKAHIQDVARNYCSTFHAGRTRQLRALKVLANLARAAYLADPTSLPALDQLRHTAADLQQHRQQQAATDALRAGVLLHEYGDQSTYYFHHLHKQRQQATIMSSLQQQPDSPLADLCTEAGRQQADSIIVSFFSADSPTGMFKQLPTDMAAQQALLSSVDRQLPPEAQQECEGPSEGITLAELHSALKASARGKKPGSDGLPYEFYTQFWDLLGPELLAVLQDSFQTQLTSSLPASMTQGVITLLYKGKGARSSLDNYRPITLLNSDYKLLAKALATSSLPPAQGGVGLVEVPTQIQALQAKVVSRLLEPERLAWKVFQLHHLSSAPHTRALAYGATILFSTVSINCLQLPARLTWYVTAFKALQPHRLLKVDAMPAEDVLNEPIFSIARFQYPRTGSALGW